MTTADDDDDDDDMVVEQVASRESYDDDDLRAIAASLAPGVCELLSDDAFDRLLGDDVMVVDDGAATTTAGKGMDYGTETTARRISSSEGEGEDEEDEDDGMDDELRRLSAAEETLRDELEFVSGGLGMIWGGSPGVGAGPPGSSLSASRNEVDCDDKEEVERNGDDEEGRSYGESGGAGSRSRRSAGVDALTPLRSLADSDEEDSEVEAEGHEEKPEAKEREEGAARANDADEDGRDSIVAHKGASADGGATASGKAGGAAAAAASSGSDGPLAASASTPQSRPPSHRRSRRRRGEPDRGQRGWHRHGLRETPTPLSPSSLPSTSSAAASFADAMAEAGGIGKTSGRRYYTLDHHARLLNIRKDSADLGRHTCPVLSPKLARRVLTFPPPSSDSGVDGKGDSEGNGDDDRGMGDRRLERTMLRCAREYVKPASTAALRKIFAGIALPPAMGGSRVGSNDVSAAHPSPSSSAAGTDRSSTMSLPANPRAAEPADPLRGNREPLPVRTVLLRVRPDVLCGAVMDGVFAAVQVLGGDMTKRQGGHLRAVLPGCRCVEGEAEREGGGSSSSSQSPSVVRSLMGFASRAATGGHERGGGTTPTTSYLPQFSIDAQLCTRRKGRSFERALLLRCYRPGDDDDVLPPNPSYEFPDEEEEAERAAIGGTAGGPSRLLRECAALAQRMETDGPNAILAEAKEDEDEEDEEEVGSARSTATATTQEERRAGRGEGGGSSSVGSGEDGSGSYGGGGGYASRIGGALASPVVALFGGGGGGGGGTGGGGDEDDGDGSRDAASGGGSTASASSGPRRRRRRAAAAAGTTGTKASPGGGGGVDPAADASAFLLSRYRPSPSVTAAAAAATSADEEGDEDDVDAADGAAAATIPALSEEDWPYARSSWRFVRECLNEFDNRDLAYSTLATSNFGAFPSLPTLDVHYCSQLRLLCRENMIVSLLKTAGELEAYARESEYGCANLIQLLRPTFEEYGIDPPALPRPVPLTAYPLDFQPPEAACPPWGRKVMKALNQVAAASAEDNAPAVVAPCGGGSGGPASTSREENGGGAERPSSSRETAFRRAREAVLAVVLAFQRQDDEEQSARLGRKNVQVMDRLAKMQAHKRESIVAIRDSYGSNLLATRAADECHAKLRSANSKSLFGMFSSSPSTDESSLNDHDDGASGRAASEQVPLLRCGVLSGGSTGTCYVTAKQLVFITQLVPILGGSRCVAFEVSSVELVVQESSTSLLNPLPAAVSVRSRSGGGGGGGGFGRRRHEGGERGAVPAPSSSSMTAEEGKELYSFIPSLGAGRFANFVEAVAAAGAEDPDALKFSARGGLLYMFDESNGVAKAEPEVGASGRGSDRPRPPPPRLSMNAASAVDGTENAATSVSVAAPPDDASGNEILLHPDTY